MTGSQVSPDQVKSIGVGVPGTANRKTGWIEYANNLPCCQGNIRQLLQEQTAKSIYLENDANAAAWGEYLCFGDKPESFVMVTLGTGVEPVSSRTGKYCGASTMPPENWDI